MDDLSERKEFLDWLEDLEYNIFKIPKPDKVIFLNVTPQMSNTLVEKKEKREYISNDQNKDINESDSTHMKNAYTAANEIVKMYSDWVKIECEEDGKMLPREVITRKILDIII
jgi:dTMP kinase